MDLPWKTISSIAAGAAVAIVTTIGHLQEDKRRTEAEQIQAEEVMRHLGEECEVLARSDDGVVEVRHCHSDDCLHFRVVRGGTVTPFFVIAPSRIPSPPVITNMSLSAFAGPPCPRGRCISPADHGPPARREQGRELGNGWVEIFFVYRDRCRLRTALHRPSGTWLQLSETEWVCCATRHY